MKPRTPEASDARVRDKLLAGLAAAPGNALTRSEIYWHVFKYGAKKEQINRVVAGLESEGLVVAVTEKRPVVVHRPVAVVRLVNNPGVTP